MSESVISGERKSVIETVTNQLTAPFHVLNPSTVTVAVLPDTAVSAAASDTTVIAESAALKPLRDDFKAATSVGDLVDEGMNLVELTADPEGSVIIGKESYAMLAATEESVTAVVASEGVSNLQAYATAQAESGSAFALRTPGRRRIRETAQETFGSQFVEAFDAALDGVDAFPETSNVDGVTLLLILAARHEELLYDISKWGEDTGIASKATFSRTKTNLEDAGLIDTESVPIDVGRPRLRLLPGNDDVASVADAELIDFLTGELTE